MEVSQQPCCHHRTTTARGGIRSDKLSLLDALEQANFLEVVKATIAVVFLVDDLTQQLDGRLGTIRLRHGHVQIVDEKQESLA